MKPALIVHGGAWDIPDEAVDACKSGCQRALGAGWTLLAGGGSALDAVEAAIMVLEDDPVFDAGYGSHLNLDGRVECDAIVMNGATLRSGAAATLQRVKNPIQLARKILENCPHMMLVAEGAERFAKEHGIKLCKPEELVSEAEQEAWMKCKADKHAAEHHRGHEQGTVGAVAIDRDGRLFAATSTGGTCCKLPGRVGDSPLIGCGCYADSEATPLQRPMPATSPPPISRRAKPFIFLASARTLPAASSCSIATAIPVLRSTRRGWPTATWPWTATSSSPFSPVRIGNLV